MNVLDQITGWLFIKPVLFSFGFIPFPGFSLQADTAKLPSPNPWKAGRMVHSPFRSDLHSLSASICWMQISTAALEATDWQWRDYKDRTLCPWNHHVVASSRPGTGTCWSLCEWEIKLQGFKPLQTWRLGCHHSESISAKTWLKWDRQGLWQMPPPHLKELPLLSLSQSWPHENTGPGFPDHRRPHQAPPAPELPLQLSPLLVMGCSFLWWADWRLSLHVSQCLFPPLLFSPHPALHLPHTSVNTALNQ